MAATAAPLTIEIWSDVVCPWCYIGKRRFERALARLGDDPDLDVDPDTDIHVSYRAFQLDPTAPPGVSQSVVDAYAEKFGGVERARAIMDQVTAAAAGDGIEFRLDIARRANTLLAHRLLWWADQEISPVTQTLANEAILRAYFVEGRDIGDPTVLADVAASVGADRDEVAGFLAGDGGRSEVAEQLERAADLGITAVPTFVVNGRWGIPGAQDSDTFERLLRRLLTTGG